MARLILLILIFYSPAGMAGNPTAPFVGSSFEDAPCHGDSVGNGSGPWDYRERSDLWKELHLVERHHFTQQVEMLTRGQTAVDPHGDIVFTLTYWPNHHRALNSMSIYDRQAASHNRRLILPAECWLQRAINFSPNDATTRMLYAIFLHRGGLMDRAHSQYLTAKELDPEDLSIAYNHGLLLMDMKKYSEALSIAEQVYAMGYPLPGLRQRLKEQGHVVALKDK